MDAIKGPWCVIRCDDGDNMNMLAISMEERPDYHLGDYDDERRIDPAKIAAIVYRQSRPLVCPDDDEGAEARARLISAAPDLLRCAQDFMEVLSEGRLFCNCGEADCRTTRLREAIAKATDEAL